jgi:hypothetical protein
MERVGDQGSFKRRRELCGLWEESLVVVGDC